MEYPSYPEYKDSGVDWLGEVPAHWEVRRLGTELRESSERNYPELPLLSITREEGVIVRNISDQGVNHNYIPDDLSNYKFLRKGELGINKMKAWQGSYGISPIDGIVSPAYFVFSFSSDFSARFLELLLRSQLYVSVFARASDGVRIGQWDLSKPRMANIRVIVPSLSEQKAIAAFLDAKTAQIDQAIAQNERMVALLRERQQIVVQEAVTKGLDPEVKMKDSGVEWIGEVPAHWEVVRLKQLSKVQTGLTLGKKYGTAGLKKMPYLRVANVQDGHFKLDLVKDVFIPESEIKGYLLRKGDILVTEGGDIDKLGRGAVWKGEITPCLHQNHVFAVRITSDKTTSRFVVKLFESNYGRKYFTNTATKTTNLASTNSSKLGNFPVLFPPLPEQKAIVAHIEAQAEKTDRAISLLEQQNDRLKEYKTVLIDRAVTGKINITDHVPLAPTE